LRTTGPTWHHNVGQFVTQYVYKEVANDVRGCAETCRVIRFARERSATQLIFPLHPGKTPPVSVEPPHQCPIVTWMPSRRGDAQHPRPAPTQCTGGRHCDLVAEHLTSPSNMPKHLEELSIPAPQ